ncbi:angiopoietin-related protein 6 isoform X1 [Toxotes jaculatrix]|uniref:angiopoietin-related protein 6 isoform X1 n=1 Tax=Toxotes jaculatrix TaxID=941984 RepID=UPI001B3A9146|nr:angiopoietin-related protein 6 isoform X1 [Toxotes jaculatrix]
MLCLLMLMVLLYGVDSTCTNETLILDPSEVIEEFGKVVSANCTSLLEDHVGMYWSNGTRTTDIEEEGFFISQEVTLSDWNVMAECKILLNSSFECSKKLEITVYKNPDEVTVYPLRYLSAAVEGTEYELQCDISDVAPVQNLIVRWYKNKEMIHEQNFTNTTKTPTFESSILRVNISREEGGAQFTCEAQLDFGPNGLKTPVVSGTHNISVHYAPELNSNATEDIYVQEGNDVTLNCEAESNPPPHFHWIRDGLNMKENTNSLNITQVNGDTVCTCIATNKLGKVTKLIRVHVIRNTMATPTATTATPNALAPEVAACPITLTPAEIVVRFGDPASVICNTSATNVSGMGWEAAYGGTGFEQPPVTWKVEKLETWNEIPECYITLRHGWQCSVFPAITIYKSPDNVSLSALHDGPMVEGGAYLLISEITNVAPVQNLTVKWFRGSENVKTQVFESNSVTPDTVNSTLSVAAKREYNGALFTCSAELHLGPHGPQSVPTTTSEPYTAVVHFAPEFNVGNYSKEVTPGENVTFDCSAEGNPAPEIMWTYTTAVNARESTGGRQKTISVTGATSTNAGVYICVATNKVGRVSRSVTLTMKGATAGLQFPILLVVLILCGLLFLTLTLILIIHNKCKKHGQYSFIPGQAKECDIPLTTKSEGGKA